MKKFNQSIIVITVFTFSILFYGGYALANTIEGTIQGLNCVLHGKICPVDGNDPHVAAENVFVVYAGKDDYKIIANMDRSITSRYLGKKVRVDGDVNSKYKAIEAKTFQVMKDGKYKTVWTLQRELQERENFIRGGGGGR